MSPSDVPQVPSEHAGTIIGGNWPQTSETGTVASVIELYRRAAESVGTGDTAGTMQALIEANASGVTPTNLVEHFTTEQRAAFDRSLAQLNQGQGASVMAQDILNTKVQLNGTVVSFEAAVDQLLAAAAAAPQSPKTQAEFEKRYQELLDEAKQQADQLGRSHRSTQDALVAGVQKGMNPDIPATMAPTSPEAPTVPGMPENALGSLLQNVAGQMLKPQNLPMPNLGQMGQSMAPLAQSAQAAIGQLMSSLGGGAGAAGGVPISDDALSVLTKSSGVGDQNAALSAPVSAAGAGAATAAGGGAGAGRTPTTGDTTPTSLAAEAPDNAKASLSGTAPQNATAAAPPIESSATAPAAPAVTAAPTAHIPTTTLSSTDTAGLPDTLGSARTHASAGDATVGAAALNPASAAVAAPAGAASGPMPMMPMMPMGGFGGAPAPATGGSTTTLSATADARKAFDPDRPAPAAELTDFGSDLKRLEHATDMQLVASSILAALVRVHDRMGVQTEIAVGVSPTIAVFVTSDGLGFIPPGVRAAAHITPLINQVPSDFIARWLGCDQPWRPLLEAAAINLVGPFEAVATTDSGASAFGVLALTPAEIESVNITAGAKDRWFFDAVDAQDVQPALTYLESVWGRPLSSALDLENQAAQARWTGDAGPGLYPRRWARYLIAAAVADLAAGDIDDARYALRCGLRIPEIEESRP